MNLSRFEADPKVLNLIAGHFNEGAEYRSVRPKGSDSWLLIYTAAGSGRIGNSITQPGDWTLFRPRVSQDYGTAADHWELIWCHFHPRPHWLAWLNWDEDKRGISTGSFPEHPKLVDLFRSCRDLAASSEDDADAFAMNRLEELLLRISRLHRSERLALDPRIQQAIASISTELAHPVTIPDLASRADLSPSRFSHLFREQLGVTPGEFVERARMDRAGALLRLTDQPIQDIATQVGFENPFYFTLRFKKRTGLSPTQYRRMRSQGDQVSTRASGSSIK